MPAADQLAAFLVASFLLIQIPGPSLLFTIGRALSVSRRAALLSVLGNASGLWVQATVVALTPAAQSHSWQSSMGARGLTQLLAALKPLLPEPAARLLPG